MENQAQPQARIVHIRQRTPEEAKAYQEGVAAGIKLALQAVNDAGAKYAFLREAGGIPYTPAE